MANEENLKSWKPGQTGNPKGSSEKQRARRTTEVMLELVAERGAELEIAVMWLQSVLAGDFRYFKEYLDRSEGKVPDVLETTDTEKYFKSLERKNRLREKRQRERERERGDGGDQGPGGPAGGMP